MGGRLTACSKQRSKKVSQTFEQYVDEWDNLCNEIAKIKPKLKILADKEMAMRKAIEASLVLALGDQLKEGGNNFPLANGRTLKYTHGIDRKVLEPEIKNARDEFAKLNDVPCTFDQLLRVKYELDKRNYDKLSDAAKKVVSRALETKFKAPILELK